MTRCVSFQNPGVIDPKAYTLFGASAKEGSNPIGFFGTGLKYAIAIFLRLGCKVELYRGLDKMVFGLEEVKMRQSQFKVVTAADVGRDVDQTLLNERQLPFTTELGKTWKAWQALRELWCNTLDEGGEMQPIRLDPREGHTTIIVTGQAAMDAYHEREKIMLQGTAAAISEGVEIHERRGNAIYFRGIRVLELEKPSALTYNVVGQGVELTEDRTAKYSYYVHFMVAEALAHLADERLLMQVFSADDKLFEYGLDFADHTLGEPALRVLEERIGMKVQLNRSAYRAFLKQKGYGLKAVEFKLSSVEIEMMTRARKFCKAMGLDPSAHEVVYVESLEDNVLGLASVAEGKVYITKRAFMQGTKVVAGTLLEELIHMKTRLLDESRSLQNYLVDMLVSQYEEKTGAPL